MLNWTNKFLLSVIKSDLRFISLIKKTRKPIITQDEQIFPDNNEPVTNQLKLTSRKGNSFYEHYIDKAIERLELNDDRLGTVILKGRSLTSESNDLLVVEGINMIRDAIKLNAQMTDIYFTQRQLLKEIPFKSPSSEARIFYVTYENMKKFSNLKTPPGIMAVFKRPDPTKSLVDPIINKRLPLTLILDNIRDPGNLGTIIRTGAGLNVNKILLGPGCVDLYNEKVLRGSMSSLFCCAVFDDLNWDDIRSSLHPDTVVYYADISSGHGDTDSFPYYDDNVVDFKSNRRYALVIGGEINGISQEARRLSADTYGYKLHIPMVSAVDSFNSSIAAAIIMAEFQRKFLTSK